jgi:hypothetical protein
MDISAVIVSEIIEKECNVLLGAGGFSMHDNNATIGMNVLDECGQEQDHFISVDEYLVAVKNQLEKC